LNAFLNLSLLVRIFQKIEEIESDTEYLLSYIGFIFSSIFYKTLKPVDDEILHKAKVILQNVYLHRKKYNLTDAKCSSLVKELYNETLPGAVDFPFSKKLSQIIRVKEYYMRQASNHDGQDDSSHPNSYVAISILTNKLGRFQTIEPTVGTKAGICCRFNGRF